MLTIVGENCKSYKAVKNRKIKRYNKRNTEIIRVEIKQLLIFFEHRFVITVQLTARQWDYVSQNDPRNELDALCTAKLGGDRLKPTRIEIKERTHLNFKFINYPRREQERCQFDAIFTILASFLGMIEISISDDLKMLLF